jgi:hypothetical protein
MIQFLSTGELKKRRRKKKKAALRRNYLTREEQEEFWAEYHNDTYWANLTLRPLARGAEDTEEVRLMLSEVLLNDTYWANLTLRPLARGEDTEEECLMLSKP